MKRFFALMLSILLAFSTMTVLVGCRKESEGESIEKYSLTVTAGTGGKAELSESEVDLGACVTLTLTPDEGYGIYSFTLNGRETEVSNPFGKSVFYLDDIMSDYAIAVEFAKKDITVEFAGEGCDGLQPKQVLLGKSFGELPVPLVQNKKFDGWVNSDGALITEQTLVKSKGTISLSPKFSDLTDDYKQGLAPFTITTSYYDMAATKYGVAWHTSVKPLNPQVLVKEGNTEDFTDAVAVDCTYGRWDGVIGEEYYIFSVVEGLKFDTEYSVKLGDYMADEWSAVYHFTTREEYPDDVNFIYVTDTQENQRSTDPSGRYYLGTHTNSFGHTVGATHAEQVLAEAFDRFSDVNFIAHGGDTVNQGGESGFWKDMIGSYEEYLFNYPMVAVAGNHEEPQYYGVGRGHLFDRIFNVNCDTTMSERGIYYSFDYGNMHFICLNSNDYLYDYEINDRQLRWFEEDLQKANANEDIKWIVVMAHEGPVNPQFKNPTSNAHQNVGSGQLIPLCTEYGVDLFLFGHDHILESTYPVVWDESVAANNDGSKIRNVATLGSKLSYDGVEVDTFAYTGTERGTIFHQIGCSGPQVNADFKLSDAVSLQSAYPNYRSLLSGGKGAIDNEKGYSMYSYIEVKANALTVRTYGVDTAGVWQEMQGNASDYGAYARYVDGFQITK